MELQNGRRSVLWRLAATGLLLVGAVTCSPGYVIRAGLEEGKILSRRRSIDAVVSDPETDDAERRKLRLVVAARDFAQHVLELDAGDSYTTYSWVESDTLLLVVSAAYRDRFEARTWWFPIVGRVPYKGFFNFNEAHREAERLREDGFDTYVRPSPAFSTLGFFNDPVLNTVLRTTDVALVSTVIHELLHNTLFIPSQVSFNESFASYVGDRGAIEFFCARDGEQSDTCREARDDWADNLAFGAFLTEMVDELEQLYARTDIDSARKIELREEVFERSRRSFAEQVEPTLRTRSFRGFARRPLNNATLIGIRLYYRRLDLFEQAFQHFGHDFKRSIAAIHDAAKSNEKDPFQALERALAERQAG
jgi:predicted aminopeptidase